MINSASDLLAVGRLKRKMVDVGGGQVQVRELNVREREQLPALFKASPAEANAFVIKSCVIGEDGKPLFKDEQEALELAPEIADVLGVAILNLSGVGSGSKKD
jgi:hypothetical protein